jgi:hypothetical protein
LSFWHKNATVVKYTLDDENNILINWFKSNQNPEKFQAISVGVKSHTEIKSFDISGSTIP